MKKQMKKLHLQAETVRTLSRPDLDAAAGGAPTSTATGCCDTKHLPCTLAALAITDHCTHPTTTVLPTGSC